MHVNDTCHLHLVLQIKLKCPFSAEGDNNGNNVHILRDKDLYCSYSLQHSLLARERSLAE